MGKLPPVARMRAADGMVSCSDPLREGTRGAPGHPEARRDRRGDRLGGEYYVGLAAMVADQGECLRDHAFWPRPLLDAHLLGVLCDLRRLGPPRLRWEVAGLHGSRSVLWPVELLNGEDSGRNCVLRYGDFPHRHRARHFLSRPHVAVDVLPEASPLCEVHYLLGLTLSMAGPYVGAKPRGRVWARFCALEAEVKRVAARLGRMFFFLGDGVLSIAPFLPR